MGNKKLPVAVAAAFFLIASLAFGQSAVSQELLDELVSSYNRKLQNVFQNDEAVEFSLTPDTALSRAAIGSWESADTPRFTSENLFFLKKATLVANSSAPEKADPSLDGVARAIRAISKMKGMQYYSNGDKKWETLYHKSHLIRSAKDKTPIPDDLTSPLDGKTYYCYQEDNSFGGCVYRLEFRRTGNEISACFTNVEALRYGPITAVKPGNLKIHIVLIDQGSYYLVYMMVQAVYPRISLLESRLTRSFNARMDAIYKWFTMQF